MHVIVVVRPRSREDEAAIRTQAWVKMFNEYSPPRVGLYAEVMYGGHPVVNAHVTAHVYQNNRNVAAITLRDTGGGNYKTLSTRFHTLKLHFLLWLKSQFVTCIVFINSGNVRHSTD